MTALITKKWMVVCAMGMLTVGGIVYGYYQYNRPRVTAASGKTAVQTTAVELLHDFETDEPAATKKYLNKILEVKGLVEDIDSASGNFAILVYTGSTGLINCAMTGPVSGILLKQQILVKGKCAGYMMDVMMVDCVITR